MIDQHFHGNRKEIEPLRPAPDRVEELVRLGSGQNEDYVFGGFFQSLQQSVTGGTRQHVCLIQDVDLVCTPGYSNRPHICPDLPYVFHLVVGSGIQLDDIERITLGDRDT